MSDEAKVRMGMLGIGAIILVLFCSSWFFLPILVNREQERQVREMLAALRQIAVGGSIILAMIWGALAYGIWFGIPDFALKLLTRFWR
jgi:hypothetical protein